MHSRFVWFLLGMIVAAAAAGAGAAPQECPPGFRCEASATSKPCRIEQGPYRGSVGTLVDGRCLMTVATAPAGPHEHVIQSGVCPLCGAAGRPFLEFHVQDGHRSVAGAGSPGLPHYEPRTILSCERCGALFSPRRT